MGTLYYNQVGIIERYGVGKHAIDKTIDMMRLRLNKIVLQGQRFVRKETPRGGTYKEASYSSNLELPRVNNDSERLPFVTPIPGYPSSGTVVTYRLGLQIERAYMEDDLQGIVRKQASGLLTAGRRLYEYAIADKINNLTSTGAAYLGGDGVAMASATHPHERRETGTWSNLETGAALSLASFSTSRKNMRKRTEEFGYPLQLTPALLVGPADLEQKMRELKTAEKAPENALNQPNVWRNDDWDFMVYDYMTSTTAWFLTANVPQENAGIVLAEAVAPNVSDLEGIDKSTDIIGGQRFRCRFVIVNVDGKAIQYNAGA